MYETLKEQLANTMFRFRKVHMSGMPDSNADMRKIFAMKKIAEQKETENVLYDELEHKLAVSKPALSQMFKSMEKSGYVVREIDHGDYRKVLFSLTPEGKRMLCSRKDQIETVLERTIDRFGEDNTRQLIKLFNGFADVFEHTAHEIFVKGESNIDQTI